MGFEQSTRENGELVESLSCQLFTIKTAYNSAVEELAESQHVGKQLLERVGQVEEELTAGQEHVLLLQDNVKHLEGLRDNLEKNVAEKHEVLSSQKQEMAGVKEELIKTHNKIEELKKRNIRWKGNLEVRIGEV